MPTATATATEVVQDTSVPQQSSSSSSSTTPRIVGADGLTNKERRLAKQAEKRKRAEGGQEEAEGVSSKAESVHADVNGGVAAQLKKSRKADSTEDEGSDEQGDQPEEEEEVEAISHKERRKRRKLEKKGLLPSSTDAIEDRHHHHQQQTNTAGFSAPTSSSINALPPRSAHALWVGNMNFMTSPQRLQSWFEEKGISGISRVHMPKGAKKFEQNKGFAYVDVPSAEAVESAIALSEQNLDGRRLLIKSASDYTGRPAIDPTAAALARGEAATPTAAAASSGVDSHATAIEQVTSSLPGGKTGLTKTAQKILRSQKHAPGPTLFLGNLSFNSTQESVREMLERSAVARAEWSESAAKQRKDKMKREAAKLNKAKRMAKKDESSKSGSGSDSDEEEQGQDADLDSDSDSDSESDSESDDDTPTDKDLAKIVGIRKIRMGEFEDSGKCKGFAFIDFESAAHATASLIDPHNYRLDGRELKMEFAGVDAIRRGASKDLLTAAQREGGGHGIRGGGRGGRGGSRGGRGGGGGRFDGGPPRERTWGRSQEEQPTIESDSGYGPPLSTSRPGHKETQAERQARREREGPRRRAKPGAALANAQRGKTGIDTSGVEGKRVVFE